MSAAARGDDAVKRLLPWPVAVACFMESLDTTILNINTAVPAIATALDVAPLSMKAVLASYTLSVAVFVPVSRFALRRRHQRQSRCAGKTVRRAMRPRGDCPSGRHDALQRTTIKPRSAADRRRAEAQWVCRGEDRSDVGPDRSGDGVREIAWRVARLRHLVRRYECAAAGRLRLFQPSLGPTLFGDA